VGVRENCIHFAVWVREMGVRTHGAAADILAELASPTEVPDPQQRLSEACSAAEIETQAGGRPGVS